MRTWNWRAVALAAPGCAFAAGLAVALAAGVGGRDPIWPDHRLTLSEAVVTRAEADMIRLLEEGADPNTPYEVRPGLLADGAVRVTPLEAAVMSGNADLIARLLKGVSAP